MVSALKGIALFSAILLSPLAKPAQAASCTDWPMICPDGDGRFLTGTAEVEGWIDATAIGMSSREWYRLTFTSHGVSEGVILGESAFATLEMDQSGNTVDNSNDSATYDGESRNAIDADSPYSDRFAGGVSLVPSLSFPGKIINDYSLGTIDLDVRAAQGVLWPDPPTGNTSLANVGSFNLSIGFFGLNRDPADASVYDVNLSDHVKLVANSFERLFFTVSDEDGSSTRREMTMLAAVPLPASALFLLAGLGGLAALRRRQSATA